MRVIRNQLATCTDRVCESVIGKHSSKIYLLIETRFFRLAHTQDEMFHTWYIGWMNWKCFEYIIRTYNGEVRTFKIVRWCFDSPWFPEFKLEPLKREVTKNG